MLIQSPFEDIRRDSHRSRIAIGFAQYPQTWQDAPALFSEHTLTINNHPVMEDWEQEYMQALAAIACTDGGTILEVGFGMGISATYVQSHPINDHIIIEANRDVFHRLTSFARQAQHPTTPLLGFWQDVTPALADQSIDGILFDTYPLSPEEIHKNHFSFFAEAFRLLRPGGILTYYSDEISDFSNEHIQALHHAGFTSIDKKVCQVTPPQECLYWKSDTIVAPIIIK